VNNPQDVIGKLNENNPGSEDPALRLPNLIHPEIIMYGKPGIVGLGIVKDCAGRFPPLLTGWMEQGGNSVLWNGAALEGLVDFVQSTPLAESRVRVTGVLALDCGHGVFHDCFEDDTTRNNVEIHPVYSVEIFRNPAIRPAALTGMWAASDVGTYYLRQLNDTLWWLGLSRDRGRSFANVFNGRVNDGFISGAWADIPLGMTQNSGELRLSCATPAATSTRLAQLFASGGFGATSWEKLNDRGGPVGPIS
jgi:hypothetical protein